MKSQKAIKAEHVSKHYRLGSVAHVNLSDEIRYQLRRLAGKDTRLFSKTTVPVADHDFWALTDISFDVDEGEAVAFIGANGAGKSTMLKILSRITTPTSGKIVINGRMGTMLEVGTGFHPELTGRENIYLNGTILGMSKKEIDKKFDSIVAFSEIEHFLDTPIKRYSSGMYVRLAFAVASHLEPEVLIVDEVLAVGDAAFQQKCITRMQDIASAGKTTILFVSHSMQNVQKLCNRCILFDKGRISLDGPTDEVSQEYMRRQCVWKTNSFIRIADRTDRKGDGTWKVADAHMVYDVSLHAWVLTIDYFSAQKEIHNPILVIGIRRIGVQGDNLTVLDSGCGDGLPKIINGTGKINVIFSSEFMFAQGDYECDITCKNGIGNTGNGMFADQVLKAFGFHAAAAPVFGQKRLPFSKSDIYVKHEWVLSQDA